MTKKVAPRRATEREHLTKGRGSEFVIRKRNPPCFVVQDENENLIHIEKAKRNTNYFCVNCHSQMIPKMGDVKIHHFAHKPLDEGNENFCGGEGFRHLRVKTIVHQMLQSISRHNFSYDLKFIMEKSHGQDRPDILVTKEITQDESFEVLAIEIVDTHPPSEEKRNRWNNRMLEITITDWTDELISDVPQLCGKLMPWLVNFNNLTSAITTLQLENNELIEKMIKSYEELVYDLDYKKSQQIEKYIEELKLDKSKSKTLIGMPEIWPGSFKSLGEGKWGVTVTTEKHEPQEGDYSIIITKNGMVHIGLLGELISAPPEHLYYYKDVELRYDFKLKKQMRHKKLQKMLEKIADRYKR